MVGSDISEEEEEKNVITVCDKVEFGDGLSSRCGKSCKCDKEHKVTLPIAGKLLW